MIWNVIMHCIFCSLVKPSLFALFLSISLSSSVLPFLFRPDLYSVPPPLYVKTPSQIQFSTCSSLTSFTSAVRRQVQTLYSYTHACSIKHRGTQRRLTHVSLQSTYGVSSPPSLSRSLFLSFTLSLCICISQFIEFWPGARVKGS